MRGIRSCAAAAAAADNSPGIVVRALQFALPEARVVYCSATGAPPAFCSERPNPFLLSLARAFVFVGATDFGRGGIAGLSQARRTPRTCTTWSAWARSTSQARHGEEEDDIA